MKEKINKNYLKGFNDAYILSKDKSSLIDFLIKTNPSNNYLIGLKDGYISFLKGIVTSPNKKTKQPESHNKQ